MTYAVNLIPAYHRDYTDPKDVLRDWTDGKDFMIADIGNRWDGRYTSERDWHGQAVRVRFNRNADFVIIRDAEIVGTSND